MKLLSIFFTFFVISASGLSQQAFAGITCAVCHTKPEPDQKVMTCAEGHLLEQECAAYSVEHHANILQLEAKGMSCCGENCEQNFSIDQIRELLTLNERLALDERLSKAKAPVAEIKPKTETQALIEGLEEAFNLWCPNCGCTLDQVEGCNAATCSNEECQSTFCYLCLKPQENSQAAHAHVREHSGNYWEYRSGFADRYKWILVRKKLAELFSKDFPENVRNEALRAREDLLQENNMWPMPAGLMSSQWIEQVQASDFPKEKMIELFQNEFIYRKQLGDLENAAVVESELKKIGGKVLSSLDVKDAQEVKQNNAITPLIADHPDPRVAALVAQLQQEVPQFFVHGGNEGRIYLIQDPEQDPELRVPPFVLSDATGGHSNHYNAATLCPEGSTLPDKTQLQALGRAMRPNGRFYDRNAIPGMSDTDIWSSVVHPDRDSFAFFFFGSVGLVGEYKRVNDGGSVRCVRQVAAW